MAKTYTDRGFATYDAFDDKYGSQVIIRQSSLATDDCLWIFSTADLPHYKTDGALHLTVSQAKRIKAAINEWFRDIEKWDKAWAKAEKDRKKTKKRLKKALRKK